MPGKPFIMRKRISRTGVLCGIALTAASQMAAVFDADGEGYLAKVGPPPLRYQTVYPWQPSTLPPLLSETNATTETSSPPAAVNSFSLLSQPASTEIPARFFVPSALWVLNGVSGTNSLSALLPASTSSMTNTTGAVSPASDLLMITPEFLTEYLTPVQVSSNAPGATVPIPLQFTPAIPEVRGSSATYRTP